jgi:prophage endopeptidase
MKLSYQILIVLFVISLAGGLVYSANHYNTLYQSEKKRANDATTLAESRKTTIDDMTVRQRDVAALDAKYTGELADAKATIEQLQRDVAAGNKRLHLNATCSKPVSKPTGTASLDDATSPGLTDAAERDYFTLRQRIETAGKQIAGLQDYIKQQCRITNEYKQPND